MKRIKVKAREAPSVAYAIVTKPGKLFWVDASSEEELLDELWLGEKLAVYRLVKTLEREKK